MASPPAESRLESLRLDLDGTIAVLTLSRPERRNALTEDVADELVRATERIDRAPEVRAVVITGQGPAFAAGADLRQVAASTPAENLAYNSRLVRALDAIERLRVPTVAAINGPALGGGLELALVCTLRVAASSAVLGLPEVRLGILPGAGGTQRLPRLIGRGAALRMLLTGRAVDAAEALRLGLVEEVSAPEALLDAARALAGEVAGSAPLSVAAIKRAVGAGVELPLDEALELTRRELAALLESEDCREGIAAFLERRTPRFEGR
jgi:enoyl-CoA hydratase